MKIDIADILHKKTGKKLNPFLVKFVERLIHQDEINDFLHKNLDKRGVDFFREVLSEFNISTFWTNEDKLPVQSNIIFVSNHPLGALDGATLSVMLSEKYSNIKFIVNDILYNIEPLRDIFVPVNTIGAQSRDTIKKISTVMNSDAVVASFPAGYCSRFIDGKVQDTIWKHSFIKHAIEFERDIVPLHFVARNSIHFYLIDFIRRKLGISFDLSRALLPDEMFRQRNAKFEVIVGEKISWQELKNSNKNFKELALDIRQKSYSLKR